jgi:hypothetical protein
MPFLATYPTPHMALTAERALRAQGFRAELVPVPASLRPDCAFGILFREEELEVSPPGASALFRVLPDPPGGKRYERIDPLP